MFLDLFLISMPISFVVLFLHIVQKHKLAEVETKILFVRHSVYAWM